MIRQRRLFGRWARRISPVVIAMLTAGGAFLGLTAAPASAGTTPIGSACGYYTNVSLFGGPYVLHGCGQDANQPAVASSPSVTLPSTGSSQITQTDSDGALSQYGPAIIFGGQYDANDNVGNSGSLQAWTMGTPTTAATSNANAYTVGPGPFVADFVRAYCSATVNNAKTMVSQYTNAQVITSTDMDGYPATTYNVSNPAPNTSVPFEITNMGDHGHVVLNERILNTDGSTTVTAMHMYMEGPIAYGDMVIGQARCGH
jgi:hypothetical protein